MYDLTIIMAEPELFSIDNFASYFDGGARSYLFMYKPSFPSIIANKINTSVYPGYGIIYVRATSLPESNIEEAILPFRGFEYKVSARRVYSDWTVTFNSDRKYDIRSYFEQWMNLIVWKDDYHPKPKIDDYKSTQDLYTKNYDGSDGIHVQLNYAWPKSIGPITFDYSAMDVVQFDVTFSYSYYEILTK